MRKHFDKFSVLVIALTLVLFAAALFVRGFTHDALLEAGVFLVSVKLIHLAYKASVLNETTHRKLDEIYRAVQRLEAANAVQGRR